MELKGGSGEFKKMSGIWDEEIKKDVVHRIIATLLKWKHVFGLLCNRMMSLKWNSKFFRTKIRSTRVLGCEKTCREDEPR